MKKTLAIITARGGSKGIPRKNVKEIAGFPLITWTIKAAMESNLLNRIIVSTDDPEIAQISDMFGAEVPFLRPKHLSEDDSPHVGVIRHAVQWIEEHDKDLFDYIMLLQPTSPLRSALDIDNAISMIIDKDADAVISVTPCRDHPYLVKRIINNKLLDFITPQQGYLSRQNLPEGYSLNGAIYIIKTDVFRSCGTLQPENTLPYVMPLERSLDIDEPWDIYLADLILSDIKKTESD